MSVRSELAGAATFASMVLFLGAFIPAVRAEQLGGAVDFVQCASPFLISAHGYPKPQRKYVLRAECALVEHSWNDQDPTERFVHLKEFHAQGEASYDGITQKAKETIQVGSQILKTSTTCTGDPFLGAGGFVYAHNHPGDCHGPMQVSGGGIDPKIVSAILKNGEPVFAATVDPTMADSLSKLEPAANPEAAPPPQTSTPSPSPQRKITVGRVAAPSLPPESGEGKSRSSAAPAAGAMHPPATPMEPATVLKKQGPGGHPRALTPTAHAQPVPSATPHSASPGPTTTPSPRIYVPIGGVKAPVKAVTPVPPAQARKIPTPTATPTHVAPRRRL
jgi:hypothetical protein